MDALQMAKERHSVRKYKKMDIEAETAENLRQEIKRLNAESGLDMQLITKNASEVFSSMPMKLFGWGNYVPAYIAVIGEDDFDLDEKCGYYGEHLVLYAQSLGLNTCWVGMFKKENVKATIRNGHRMAVAIAVGYGENIGKKHKSKKIEDVTDVEDMPEWFVNGLKCALLAPTSMNRQKFLFTMDGDNVMAKVTGKGEFVAMDLGIVKYHFELGSGHKVL